VIAVDTSALVAVAFGEADAQALLTTLAANECVIGAPTVFEAQMVVRSKTSSTASIILNDLLGQPNLMTVGFERTHLPLAWAAFEHFGKGCGHPAQLNIGDCLAYAVAKRDRLPLLYKGDAFAHTDIASALA
jgi:ribonuclease VapC